MKRFVNGVEAELRDDPPATLSNAQGVAYVRSPSGTHSAAAVRVGDAVHVSYLGRQFVIEKRSTRVRAALSGETGDLVAMMPGLIVDVLVEAGQDVEAGDRLFVLEAMKTQQAFRAPFAGRVAELTAQKGAQVEEGTRLARIEPRPSSE